MRIVGGELSGRRIAAPRDETVRPTSDRAREAIFNMLYSLGLPKGCRVVDLFAGSRYWGGGHYQEMRQTPILPPTFPENRSLFDTKPVLFVDNNHAERVKVDAFLDKGVRPNDKINSALRHSP